jgi:plastocyanin
MITRRTTRFALILTVFAALVPSVLLGVLAPPAAAAGHSVAMAHYQFSPTSMTIAAGDTVTWTNADQATHNVVTTSAPASINSGDVTTGHSFSYQFTVPGTYSYVCTYHPGMTATITVKPAAAPAPAPVPVPAPAPPINHAPPATPTTHATESMVMVPPSSSVVLAVPPAAAPPPSTSATMDMSTAPTQQPVVASTTPAAAQSSGLNPLLLVAGLVAAIATLCLLLLGSKPESR